jgi:hypothetical protein
MEIGNFSKTIYKANYKANANTNENTIITIRILRHSKLSEGGNRTCA